MIKRLTTTIIISVVLLSLFWVGLIQAKIPWSSEQATLEPYRSYGSGQFFFPPYESDSDRMGFGKASHHDASVLNAGWYVDWMANANPSHPGGAEYARTIYFNIQNTGSICGGYKAPATEVSQVTFNITGTALVQNVQAHPGALWLVGNEPDSIYNGSPIQAELYAELYHYFYTTIKTADPTAKVAVAAIVQPSPLRREYLDRVLAHYQATYGEPLPTDLWNIHLYIFNEVHCSWGAGVPPFISGPGWQIDFTPADLLDVPAMESHLRDFRGWMKEGGYEDIPLIITEFGVLPPPSYTGFGNLAAAAFLDDIFDMLLTATDPDVGYAADGDRLVQMWAWFSTNHFYGGDLFCGTDNDQYDPLCDNSPNALTSIGEAFVAQTTAHYTPYVDLQLVPPETLFTTTNALTISAYMQNQGNAAATDSVASITLKESASQTILAETELDLGQIEKRYTEDMVLIGQTWQVSSTDIVSKTVPYSVSITLNSDDINLANNTLSYQVNWRPLIDLAVNGITFSSGSTFPYEKSVTIVATTTVTNRGNGPAPQTTIDFMFDSSGSQTQSKIDTLVVPALLPGQSAYLTTTLTIMQPGRFEVSAVLPPAIDAAELYTVNNHYTATLLAAGEVIYLPFVLKNANK
jgi:hypothetical protein